MFFNKKSLSLYNEQGKRNTTEDTQNFNREQ